MAFPALPGLSRGPQGEEAAEETGSPTLALPGSRPSPSFPLQLFSRGPPEPPQQDGFLHGGHGTVS